MGDLFFGIKMLVVACLIILAMQIRVADSTIEDHFQYWAHESAISNFLQGTADGAVKLGRDSYDWGTSWSREHFGWPKKTKERSSARRSLIELKRSEASGHGESEGSHQ